ncbi:MAG: glycosyltransferase family 4 protein [Georgfuchsia sp.]
MKIVHTEASCGWGGQEIRILEESKGMIERGHQVTVLCPAESRIHAEAARWGVATEALPIGRKNLAGLLALRRWLKSHEVDVLNTHSSTDSWLAALACASINNPPPIVRTRHISAPIPDNAPTRWLYTKATRHIVTTGEALRRELIERNGYPPAMITSVPTGIDPARFAPGDKQKTRKTLGLDPECQYIGIVATLRSWKGHLYLLDAFAALNAPGWKLLIVGDGPMRSALETRIAELGISDRAILAGQQKNPEDWLRALDIFCLPSYANEGVPQALVQAMLSGIPVISTAIGAIPEVLTHDINGLIVQQKDSAELASALSALLNDPDRRRTLGLNARAESASRFGRKLMLEKMERIFTGILNRTCTFHGA